MGKIWRFEKLAEGGGNQRQKSWYEFEVWGLTTEAAGQMMQGPNSGAEFGFFTPTGKKKQQKIFFF